VRDRTGAFSANLAAEKATHLFVGKTALIFVGKE
jgi:hypothetical protein